MQKVRPRDRRGHAKLLARPTALTLEATNVCNLKCPFCFTGVGEVTRERGMMPMERYRRLIDELGGHALLVEFYNWGEPFLNPEIFDMIRELSTETRDLIFVTHQMGFARAVADRADYVRYTLDRLGDSGDGF